jgi:hypothetical protein
VTLNFLKQNNIPYIESFKREEEEEEIRQTLSSAGSPQAKLQGNFPLI